MSKQDEMFPEGISAHDNIKIWPVMKDIDKLVIAIEQEIDSLEIDSMDAEVGEVPQDFAHGLCLMLSDDWCIIKDSATNGNDHPPYPDWLHWIVVGALKKKGFTEL